MIYLICGFIINCQADSFPDVGAQRCILGSERACRSCENYTNLEVDKSKLNWNATCYV